MKFLIFLAGKLSFRLSQLFLKKVSGTKFEYNECFCQSFSKCNSIHLCYIKLYSALIKSQHNRTNHCSAAVGNNGFEQ